MYDRIDKMEILIGDERVKKLREMFSWSSLKGRMLSSFIITAVIPAVLLIFFSYVNTFYIVKNNTENLLRSNLEQAREYAGCVAWFLRRYPVSDIHER